MEYYNPNDNSTKRYAAMVTIAVMGLIGVLVSFISVSVVPKERHVAEVVVEFLEEPKPEKQPEPPARKSVSRATSSTDVRKDTSPAHVEESKEEPQSAEAKGEEPKTQTLNPQALFDPTEALSTESVAVGNRVAPDGDTESRHGDGVGYNLEGSDMLDKGLQGRGLREALQKPRTSYNRQGTVVVRVEVNADGDVVSAMVEKGSDHTLIELALEAAKKAKFNKGGISVGTITYVFEIH